MKKIFLSTLIFLILCLSCSVAFAESDTISVEYFAPEKSEHISLDSPNITALSDDYFVFFHRDEMRVTGKNDLFILSSFEYESAVIYEDVLYAVASDNTVKAHNLISGEKLSTHPLSSYTLAQHITIDNSTVYLLDGSNVVKCDLSEQNPSCEIVQTLLGVTTFEVANDTLIYSTDSTSGSKLYFGSLSADIESSFFDLATDEYIFALSRNKTTISVYDKIGLNKLYSFSVNSAISDIQAYNNNLYLTDTRNHSVIVYSVLGSQAIYKTTICKTGSSLGKFNTPTSVYAHGSTVIVADKLNNRVQVFNTNGDLSNSHNFLSWDTSKAPETIVEYSGTYFVVANNSVYRVNGNQVTIYDTFNSPTSLAIDCFGTIYVTDGNKIYSKGFNDSAFKEFLSAPSCDITVSPKGSVLYVLTNNTISAYDSLGSLIFTSNLQSELSSNAKFDTDVSGTAYIIDNRKLYKYSRSVSSFDFEYQKDILLDSKAISPTSISLSLGGTIYLTDSTNHCVYSISSEDANTSVYNPNSFSAPTNVYEKTPITAPAGYVKVNSTDAFAYDFAQSFENARIVPANTLLLLLDNDKVNDFYYVYYQGKDCYIHSSYVTEQATQSFSSYDGFALHSTKLYKYPVIDVTNSFALENISNGTLFKVVGNAGEYTSTNLNGLTVSWNEVLYNGKIYYITRNNIAKANVNREVDYGYAKLLSDTVGKKVLLYALPDESSAILGEYTDGTEVKLMSALDTASTFTEVKIGDKIGYVRTSQLTTNGLTTAQIVILVLILIGGASSVTILIINRKMHRSR